MATAAFLNIAIIDDLSSFAISLSMIIGGALIIPRNEKDNYKTKKESRTSHI